MKRHGRTVKKSELPEKICPVCVRPFVWRKKWERDWGNVIYCSDKCRCAGKSLAS
ncbi:MAG: DUF2256 domain-containing protein [Gammaproteobacteria bacterium]|nr:DUF2256 domain-containing protein [Gammaproteobacteria bacterium]